MEKMPSKKRLALAMFGVAVVAVTFAGLQWAADKPVLKKLPDLLGSQRPLPAGAIHIDDLVADMSNYKGIIVVRGVVAGASKEDASLFSMIDSREARVCADLHCARHYLRVRMAGTRPNPWDELDVRGTVTKEPGKDAWFIQAESVTNLGSIK